MQINLNFTEEEEHILTVYANAIHLDMETMMSNCLRKRLQKIFDNPIGEIYDALMEMKKANEELDEALDVLAKACPPSTVPAPAPETKPEPEPETKALPNPPWKVFYREDIEADKSNLMDIIRKNPGIRSLPLARKLFGDYVNLTNNRKSFDNLLNYLKVLEKQDEIHYADHGWFIKPSEKPQPSKDTTEAPEVSPKARKAPSPACQPEEPIVQKMKKSLLTDKGLECQTFVRAVANTPDGKQIDLEGIYAMYTDIYSRKSVEEAVVYALDQLFEKDYVKRNSIGKYTITKRGRQHFLMFRD